MTPTSARAAGPQGRAVPVRGLLIALVAVAVVTVDQLTKAWAVRHFADAPRHVVWTLHFVVQYNSGVAFSQATGATSVVTIVALGVLAAMLVIARRTTGMFTAVIFGLIIGGAAGNLADRLVRHHGGAVVDWIDLRWWPVFNVADAAISIGVVLALARTLFAPDRPRAG